MPKAESVARSLAESEPGGPKEDGCSGRAAAAKRQRTGAQAVWEALVAEEVEVVFGYPGGAIMPTYDAMLDYPIRHVLVRHEQGAAHMADGYARASGKVGVAIATSGPGALNLVTGIATAMLDSSPIVCITGQVPSGLLGSDAFQETDITGVTLPITKHNYLVTEAENIVPTIREAFELARSGRPGPVVVDISKDAQQATIDRAEPKIRQPTTELRSGPINLPSSLEAALRLIREARRPLILAGQGVIKAGAGAELLRFAETAQAPVACTLLGLGGFPASHPLALGMMGMHGEAWVNQAIQEADLLLAFGMRFDDRVTGSVATYAPMARKIHVEIDAAEINKNVKVDVAIVGDLRQTLLSWLPQLEQVESRPWVAHIEQLKAAAAKRCVQGLPDDGRLLAPHVLHDLWRLTEGRALVVTDVGQHQMWEAQYYKHDYPRKLLTSGGLGTMGFALPAAMGARFARPEDDIWVVAGDGGFQMTAAELTTCVQEGLKVNIALINNGYLGMVRQWQEFFYERRYAATPLVNPNFCKLAEAHGLKAMTVTQRQEIPEAISRAKAEPGTFLVEFQVEREDSVYPMVPAGAALNEMITRPTDNTESMER